MTSSSQSPSGMGNLKGSEYLLFSDWYLIAHTPSLPLYDQINKARDILIRTAVIIEDNAENAKKYRDVIDECRSALFSIMRDYRELGCINGADEWKNENWIKVTCLLYYLYKLQYAEKLIETDVQARMQVP